MAYSNKDDSYQYNTKKESYLENIALKKNVMVQYTIL